MYNYLYQFIPIFINREKHTPTYLSVQNVRLLTDGSTPFDINNGG